MIMLANHSKANDLFCQRATFCYRNRPTIAIAENFQNTCGVDEEIPREAEYTE